MFVMVLLRFAPDVDAGTLVFEGVLGVGRLNSKKSAN